MRRLAVPLVLTAALAACGEVKPSFVDAAGGDDVVDASATDAPPADAPTDGANMVTLTIVKTGASGTITSAPAGINCGATCTMQFPAGTLITLSEAPGVGANFGGWSGGPCSGALPTCSFNLNSDTTVNAAFAVASYNVTVAVGGNGTGTVTSAPAGINCPGTCTTAVPYGTSITLTANPQGASLFLGWSGSSCSGTSACTFTVTGDTTVNASFALNYTLVVTRTGNGNGSVTSSPAGINCGVDCDETYSAGQVVSLTASPAADSNFVGWSGACSGTGACSVTINAATSVTANFTLKQWTLTTSLSGTGGGVITSNPAGINCGVDCSEVYDHGQVISLSATPNGSSLFTGWGGACSGSGACMVTMDQARSVTASFTLQSYGVTVAKLGNGVSFGTVTSSPAGISCGADCSEPYGAGTVVTLTAAISPAAAATFGGWNGGGCSGTGTCAVTVAAATTVNATFTLQPYTLTVNRTGTGTGTVTGGTINCGATCMQTADYGTMITLTAAQSGTSTFTGWSGGGCSGIGTCTVTLAGATTVTANFDLAQRTLTVTKAGGGFGTVTSSPAGINCGATCTANYAHGTSVTLTAAATTAPLAQDSTFTGWSGACSGTGTCTVTMDAAKSVTANFALKPNYVFVTSTTYTGAMGGIAGADAACQARANAVGLPGTFHAWLSSTNSNAISRLGTASGWIRPDGRAFANSQADLTSGKIFYTLTLDEAGNNANGKVVRTATNASGVWNGTATCSDWTDAQAAGSQTLGSNDSTTFSWTSNGSTTCGSATPLYCFGADRAATVAPPALANVRRAFVSNGVWSPNGTLSTGAASADTLCANEATAAGLSGTYRALLASFNPVTGGGITAASRFTTSTAWARVDNVLITDSAAALFSPNTVYWNAPINVTANGNYLTTRAWAGGATVNSAGTPGSTCNNWSDLTAQFNGWLGISNSSIATVAFANYSTVSSINTCDNTQYHIYCLQL